MEPLQKIIYLLVADILVVRLHIPNDIIQLVLGENHSTPGLAMPSPSSHSSAPGLVQL
jgi:hypothetical protein